MKFTMKKTMVASSVTLALGVSVAHAELVTNLGIPPNQTIANGNFTMLAKTGAIVGGTNDVLMTWDGNGFNASSDYTGPGSTANVTAASTTPFNGNVWTAHDIQVFTPGTYSFNVTLGGGVPETGTLTATVGAGQLGMHMLFDWGSNANIDVFIVLTPNSAFGSGVGTSVVGAPCTSTTLNCLWTGKGYVGGDVANAPTGDIVWLLDSVDGNGDGVMGIPMPDGGPFAGFNANFNMDFTANIPPVADNFSVGVVANTPKVIDLAANASDTPPGTVVPSSVAIVVPGSGPSHGSVVNNNDGTVTYTPVTDFLGTDSFQYTIKDDNGATSNVATVTLTVSATANTPPVANNAAVTTNEDITLDIAVGDVATDADGNALSYASFDATSAQGGTVTVDGTNTILTYTPAANFNGSDTFTYSVTDGVDTSNTATITVTVNSVNDAPVCKDVTLNGSPGAPLSISVSGDLLKTCSDVEGATVTLDSTTQPNEPGSTLSFDGANTLTYTPAANFTGQDSFTYTATDGNATDTRSVLINVGKLFGNFTMLDGSGVTFGGTNDIVFSWDGTCYNSVAEADAGPVNMTMGSDSSFPFFGYPWFAHDIKVFCPGGPYTFDTCNDASVPASKCGPLSMTVPADHLGGHILFDWNVTTDIDVAIVWNNSTGGTWQNVVPTGQLYQGPAGPTPALDEFYDWISVDADGDGIPGIPFVDGPFINFRANFNFKTKQSGGGGPVTVPETSVPGPNLGGPGGCTISLSPAAPRNRGEWAIVSGFLAWLGIRIRARVRQRRNLH